MRVFYIKFRSLGGSPHRCIGISNCYLISRDEFFFSVLFKRIVRRFRSLSLSSFLLSSFFFSHPSHSLLLSFLIAFCIKCRLSCCGCEISFPTVKSDPFPHRRRICFHVLSFKKPQFVRTSLKTLVAIVYMSEWLVFMLQSYTTTHFGFYIRCVLQSKNL